MRRIIHNSTAIAACLALLAPDFALAQTPLPAPEQGQQQDGAAEQAAPEATEAETLPLDAEQPAEAEAEPAPQPELPETAVDPEAPAVETPEMPPAEAEQAEEPAPDAAPAETLEQADPVQGEAQPESPAPAETEEVAPTEEPAAQEQTEPAQGEDELRRALEQQSGEAPAEEPAAQKQEPAQDEPEDELRRALEQQSGEAPAEEPAAQDEDELRRALEQQSEETAPDQQESQADAAPAEAAAAGALARAQGERAQERAGNMPGLDKVLQQELDQGLSAEQLTCLAGGAPPCADGGPMVTPGGVVVSTNNRGELLLAPARQQMNRVDGEGQIVPRVAEEDTPDTESAVEAAQETRAQDAAALAEDAAPEGEVFEQVVTEENSRSSSQDFEASLRDALAAAGGQQPAAQRDDDSRRDLTKALVLGLGAMAVGSMLNNNRQVALSTPDRVVVTRPDGSQEVIKDEVALLRRPGSTVTTENFDDGSSRSIVTRADGSKVVTIRDANLRVLRRTLVAPDGSTMPLIDDTAEVAPVDVSRLPAPAPVPRDTVSMDEEALAAALLRESAIDRRFTLGQIRNIPEVRALVPPINIDAITFDTGSAAITPDQARQLSALGNVIRDAIAKNPHEIFLIEGHTDTVGSDAMNLALSDRRAESVALALTEYFDVPPENLVVQGYGEQFLKVRAEGDIRENRRAALRRITDLLQASQQ